jgi:hypothetical protein
VPRCQEKCDVGWVFLGANAEIGKEANIKAIEFGIFTSNETSCGTTCSESKVTFCWHG